MHIKNFSFSAVKAGIRYSNRLDLGLIYSDIPCVTAGVFTTSQIKAAPVTIDMARLKDGYAQAILVNSGCANACTGDKGMENARVTSRLVAKQLGIAEHLVQIASTGVIGEQLNVQAFKDNVDSLVAGLSPEKIAMVAQAIMTTDTVPKMAQTTVDIGGRQVNILGLAKGAGMVMPNMATMLAFVMTDARILFPELQKALVQTVDRTFNRITIDGDTSTNDMVLVMASGTAENQLIDGQYPDTEKDFQDGLESVLKDLALQIVGDGEGATKTITIRVCGAKENQDAERIARTVAHSNLVKTAFFGEDANWGRIMAAMGRSGVSLSAERIDIAFGEVMIVKNGLSLGREAEKEAAKILKEKSFTVCINLHDGPGYAEIHTCDLSINYVKINADYRS